MTCIYCNSLIGHHPRCPNYIPPKASYYCSICKDPIENGEEYIENDIGEYAHYECFRGTKDLLKWLRYDIRTKEDSNVHRSY